MKVEKTYIVRIDTDLSKRYAADTAKSCDNLGIEWEYYDGYNVKTGQQEIYQWQNFIETAGVRIEKVKRMQPGAAGCTMSHLALWKKIVDNHECAVILEHDAIMLHPLTLDIPDDKIIHMGYKYPDYEKYNATAAGPPKRIVDMAFAPGSHAYALTWRTARRLVQDCEIEGITEAIDNRHFMHTRADYTKIPIAMTDPICAMGWLRDSTIWGRSAIHNNTGQMLESFKTNFTASVMPHDYK